MTESAQRRFSMKPETVSRKLSFRKGSRQSLRGSYGSMDDILSLMAREDSSLEIETPQSPPDAPPPIAPTQSDRRVSSTAAADRRQSDIQPSAIKTAIAPQNDTEAILVSLQQSRRAHPAIRMSILRADDFLSPPQAPPVDPDTTTTLSQSQRPFTETENRQEPDEQSSDVREPPSEVNDSSLPPPPPALTQEDYEYFEIVRRSNSIVQIYNDISAVKLPNPFDEKIEAKVAALKQSSSSPRNNKKQQSPRSPYSSGRTTAEAEKPWYDRLYEKQPDRYQSQKKPTVSSPTKQNAWLRAADRLKAVNMHDTVVLGDVMRDGLKLLETEFKGYTAKERWEGLGVEVDKQPERVSYPTKTRKEELVERQAEAVLTRVSDGRYYHHPEIRRRMGIIAQEQVQPIEARRF